ncbi:MAG: hypothetical protein AB7D37_11200 [Desulfovibrio sp.]
MEGDKKNHWHVLNVIGGTVIAFGMIAFLIALATIRNPSIEGQQIINAAITLARGW